jgi:hypothetical protein
MEYLKDNWDVIGQIALQVVGVAALVATLTPTKSDNKIIGLVQKLIHLLAANVGKAKSESKK